MRRPLPLYIPQPRGRILPEFHIFDDNHDFLSVLHTGMSEGSLDSIATRGRLVPSNGGSIPGNVSADILELICDNLDLTTTKEGARMQDVSDEIFSSHPAPLPDQEAGQAAHRVQQGCAELVNNVPLRKYEKNRTILAMSQVCRAWRQQLVSLGRSWRVIAFDLNSEPASVRLALLFLTKIKHRDVLLHIYAGFSLGDLVDPAAALLLSHLKGQMDRWQRFLYWGRLGQYRRYLDHPAPRLQLFSDNRDLSHLYFRPRCKLFAGQTPVLRYLAISTLGEWVPMSLAGLRTFHVRACEIRFSIGLLLNVLRHTSQLEEFKFYSPAVLSHNCLACGAVGLPYLRSVRLHSPNVQTILAHLEIPNVRSVEVSSVRSGANNGPNIGIAPQAPHPLVGLASLPILSRPINFINFSVQHSPIMFYMTIDLRTEDDVSIVINQSWAGAQRISQWKDYFERSISALAELQVSSCPILCIIMRFPFDYTPLLPLLGVRVFAFTGDFGKLLEDLTYKDGEKKNPLLPNLKCLLALKAVLTEETVWLIPPCLESRRDVIIILNAVNRARLVRALGPEYIVRDSSFLDLQSHPSDRIQVHRRAR